ncbi:MAG TPA: alpha/beta hydrolase [Galbitalea sp.]
MKLHTVTVGSGSRTAALVHGASRSTDAWRDFVPYLLEHDLTLTLVDQRGHGDSPRADSYRIEEFAQDLVDTLPTGLDFLIGQSLGGLTCALAADRLQPGRYIGVDPALHLKAFQAWLIPALGPVQKKFPDPVLRALGVPVKHPNAEDIARLRVAWSKWDETCLRDIKSSYDAEPFPVTPLTVPATLVLAGPSFAVAPKFEAELRAQGWDIRVMPGRGHDLHIEDPAGLAAILSDVLEPQPVA